MKHLNHRGRTVRATAHVDASPEQVYEAWASPTQISRWFADRAEGDTHEGGTITWYFDRFRYVMPYEIAAAVPGEQYAIVFHAPQREPGVLEIVLHKDQGSTVIEVVNSGFQEGANWEDEYQGVVSGWHMALGTLRLYVERYWNRDRKDLFCLTPAPFDYPDLKPLYLTRAGLGAWLGESDSDLVAGSRYRIALTSGVPASGTVLAITAREALLEWSEIEGTLALKAFGMGPGRRGLCIHANTWNPSQVDMAALEPRFSEALDRLKTVLPVSSVADTGAPSSR